MANKQVFPTKGNLMAIKKSHALAKMGYELMDRKRNILTREMMNLLDDVKLLRNEITDTYQRAYLALQDANVSLGVVGNLARAVPIDDGIAVEYRSVMGVEIPKIHYEKKPLMLNYGLERVNSRFDLAVLYFHQVKEMTAVLAEVENSVYRLANAIRKAQKRANALKNIVIPEFEGNIKFISDALEEKEREEFSRQKVIKLHKDHENNR
ncbi:MAG: V-type ATP synthase subunit D [Erysipelotrichaceae bacterium]|jgi:V/A-type H+-transporting ATPase subunit D|nr:V-type ATP synthase subunit D [Erysipelotrichaceae bacterium]